MKQEIKCYCGHTTYCDCGPLEVSDEAKQRAKNYMRLKDGYVEPKDVILGYKTSLDAQMLDSQYVDFSNPNADKITSNTTSTISVKQETLEEAAEKYASISFNRQDLYDGFIVGAKWQAERMYSEEEVYNLLCSMPNFFNMTIPQQIKARDKWFEQFKKQNYYK